VLEWASRGGAKILGLGQDTGTLEVGKKADLFIINMMRPHLVPTLRIVSGFVHNGQASDVQSVMVDGRWLMRDSKVLTIDEDDIQAVVDVLRSGWITTGPKVAEFETAVAQFVGAKHAVAVNSGRERVGDWVTVERDIVADYRQAFGEAPPPIVGVAIMSDSDNTGEQATAWYGDVRLAP